MARLAKLGLAIPVFSSSAVLSDKNTIQDQLDEAKEYFRLACDTKVPYVRVLGDRNPEPGENVDEGFVEEQVCLLSASAERFGVTMLLETNGVWSDTKKLAAMIDRVGSEHVGILWDVNHPVRYLDEIVAVSYANVKRHLKHVHVKDSVKVDGKIRYRMPGHGDLPLAEAMALLEKDRFGGYVCLEWVKRWNDELEDPGIVFAEFVNFMRSLK
jgi:fatty-acyl-CoA synthase